MHFSSCRSFHALSIQIATNASLSRVRCKRLFGDRTRVVLLDDIETVYTRISQSFQTRCHLSTCRQALFTKSMIEILRRPENYLGFYLALHIQSDQDKMIPPFVWPPLLQASDRGNESAWAAIATRLETESA